MAVIEVPGFIPALALKINDALERAKLSTPLQLAWVRFRRNKLRLISGVIVLLFIFVGVAAPLLAPYPYDKTKVGSANKPPG